MAPPPGLSAPAERFARTEGAVFIHLNHNENGNQNQKAWLRLRVLVPLSGDSPEQRGLCSSI